MTFRLLIEDSAYRLQRQAGAAWADLAVLPGGAQALLGPQLRTGERELEAAIMAAEDWLMPHAAALKGAVLRVDDTMARLRAGLAAMLDEHGTAWDVPALEQLFLRLADLATGRHPPASLRSHAATVADLLLLRELAHHGQLASLELQGGAGSAA